MRQQLRTVGSTMQHGKIWRAGAAGLAALLLGASGARPGAASTAAAAPPGSAIPGTANNFTQVGHDPLYNRGENAALTLYGHYVYIGSRTDSQPHHLHPGVLVVDVANPAHPRTVNEIPALTVDPRLVAGYTSRELRVWPQQKLLMVVYMTCSDLLHQCLGNGDVGGPPNFQQIAFFDLTNPAKPRLVTTYSPQAMPHELFLWVDPTNPNGRALLYSTSPNASSRGLSLTVMDVSKWRQKTITELTHFDIVADYTASEKAFCPLPDDGTAKCYDVRLHSISLTPDGTTLFMAHLGGGFLVADTSQLANGSPSPQIHLITPVANRAFWDDEGAHSAVKVPGRPYLITTEEIYGKVGFVGTQVFGRALGGCPWGWVRVIDIHDYTHPVIISEFKINKNQQTYCTAPTDPKYVSVIAEDNFSSYASHNPTVLPQLALITWHSGGLRAVDLADPLHPTEAGLFMPTPNLFSVTPDPALEPGSDNVIAWSYPIIRNGLIYFMDIRNGLFIVRYTGAHADAVDNVRFLEGNTNLGDAYALEYGHPAVSATGSLMPASTAGSSVVNAFGGGAALPLTAAATATGAAGALVALLLGLVYVRGRRRSGPQG
jgi:hypothetical protein